MLTPAGITQCLSATQSACMLSPSKCKPVCALLLTLPPNSSCSPSVTALQIALAIEKCLLVTGEVASSSEPPPAPALSTLANVNCNPPPLYQPVPAAAAAAAGASQEAGAETAAEADGPAGSSAAAAGAGGAAPAPMKLREDDSGSAAFMGSLLELRPVHTSSPGAGAAGLGGAGAGAAQNGTAGAGPGSPGSPNSHRHTVVAGVGAHHHHGGNHSGGMEHIEVRARRSYTTYDIISRYVFSRAWEQRWAFL